MKEQDIRGDCKPPFHHIANQANMATMTCAEAENGASCFLHQNSSRQSEKACGRCPIHGNGNASMCSESQSMVAPCPQRISDNCNPQHERFFNSVPNEDWEENVQPERELKMKPDVEQLRGSWNAQHEKDFKNACEKLCEQMHWKAEKHYQQVAHSRDSSFREIVHCQATLHAMHEKSVESSRGFAGGPAEQSLSPDQQHHHHHPVTRSFFSDAAFPRPNVRECFKLERPMSAPVHDRVQRMASSRGLIPEDLLQRYCMGKRRAWPPQVRKEICAGCMGVKHRDPDRSGSEQDDVHSSLRSSAYFRSKFAEQRKPRFCTGLHRGKGETMREDHIAAAKKTSAFRFLPVITLHRDKTKGVWNRKANQKEYNYGHGGCCSQHWVSVLEGRSTAGDHQQCRKKLSASLTTTPKTMFAAMAVQKLQARDERYRPQVARSLDLSSSSPLSSLKAILDDMNRPQSASLPQRRSNAVLSVTTPRSASACRSSQSKLSVISVTPAHKLKNPELNSSAWLLAKMEELNNEPFTEPKALQIAREQGIVLDKEDEATLKKFLQSDWRSSPRLDPALERSRPSEKYYNLSNISTPASSVANHAAARNLVQKRLDPPAQAAVKIRN